MLRDMLSANDCETLHHNAKKHDSLLPIESCQNPSLPPTDERLRIRLRSMSCDSFSDLLCGTVRPGSTATESCECKVLSRNSWWRSHQKIYRKLSSDHIVVSAWRLDSNIRIELWSRFLIRKCVLLPQGLRVLYAEVETSRISFNVKRRDSLLNQSLSVSTFDFFDPHQSPIFILDTLTLCHCIITLLQDA